MVSAILQIINFQFEKKNGALSFCSTRSHSYAYRSIQIHTRTNCLQPRWLQYRSPFCIYQFSFRHVAQQYTGMLKMGWSCKIDCPDRPTDFQFDMAQPHQCPCHVFKSIPTIKAIVVYLPFHPEFWCFAKDTAARRWIPYSVSDPFVSHAGKTSNAICNATWDLFEWKTKITIIKDIELLNVVKRMHWSHDRAKNIENKPGIVFNRMHVYSVLYMTTEKNASKYAATYIHRYTTRAASTRTRCAQS